MNDILNLIHENYPDSVTCIVASLLGICLTYRFIRIFFE